MEVNITDDVGISGYAISTSSNPPSSWTKPSGTPTSLKVAFSNYQCQDGYQYYVYAIDTTGHIGKLPYRYAPYTPPPEPDPEPSCYYRRVQTGSADSSHYLIKNLSEVCDQYSNEYWYNTGKKCAQGRNCQYNGPYGVNRNFDVKCDKGTIRFYKVVCD